MSTTRIFLLAAAAAIASASAADAGAPIRSFSRSAKSGGDSAASPSAFRPRMRFADTSSGRPFSKDPAVVKFRGRYWLYYSLPPYDGKPTRGWSIGVAASDNLVDWKKVGELRNTGDVERNGFCAPGAIVLRGKVHLFYAGNYNNAPQQIGVAVSDDGVHFTRLSDKPFLPNGPPGAWNSSESGHPFLFQDDDGEDYLFYQGNNDKGRTWYLSMTPIDWKDGKPVLAPNKRPSR